MFWSASGGSACLAGGLAIPAFFAWVGVFASMGSLADPPARSPVRPAARALDGALRQHHAEPQRPRRPRHTATTLALARRIMTASQTRVKRNAQSRQETH